MILMSTISGSSNKILNKLSQQRKDSKASVQDLSKYDFVVGDKVSIASNPDRLGTVVFNGTTRFSDGIWIGVALDMPFGKNNGVVQGVKYFQCEENHGIFVRSNNLRYALEKNSNILNSISSNNKTEEEQLNNSNLLKESNEFTFSEPFPVSITSLNLNLGDRVYVIGKSSNSIHKNGILRFFGYTKFSDGIWAGIELDNPVGKNDGSVNGVRYFSCKPQYGLFALENKVKKLDLNNMKCGFTKMDSSKCGSNESLSSIASNFSSASRTRVRLGMNAVNTTYKIKGDRIMENSIDKNKSLRVNMKDIKEIDKGSSAIQNVLKEKEQHVEQLIREREIERIDLATATAKIEELEKYQARNISAFNDQKLIYDKKLNELQSTMFLVCKERDHSLEKLEEEKKKVEDLLFRIEEKDIDESDLENKTEENESQIFELNEKLASERELREHLETKLKTFTSSDKTVNETNYIKQIQNLEKSLQKVQLELNDERNNSRIKSLSKLLEEKEAALIDLEDRFNLAKCHLSENKKELDSLKKLQINHTEEITLLKKEIIELQSFIENLNKHLSEIKKEDTSKSLQESNQKTNTKNINQFIQTEEDYNIVNQTKEISDLKHNLETIIKDKEKIDLELIALKDEFELHHKISEEKRLECNDLQQQSNKLELEIIEQIKSKRSIVEENDKLCSQLSSYLEQLEKLRSQVSVLHGDNRKLIECKAGIENNEKNLKTEISQLKIQIISLTKDKEILTKNLDESENDAARNSKILQMSVKIEDLESSIQQINLALKTEKEKNLTLITKNATLYSDLEHLRQKRDDEDNIIYDQLQSMKSINGLLENEKISLHSTLEDKSKELMIIRDRLLKTSQEYEILQENFNENNQKFEREKRLLNDKIRKIEKQLDENEKKSQLALSESTNEKRRSDNKDQILILKAAKENSEQQITFLNNVIIDREKIMKALQLDNQILEDRVKDLQNGNILPQSKPTKIIVPRLYCDICEVFDLHDTEKCSVIINESTPSSPHLILRTVKKIAKAPRLYCDICEIFDSHETNDCQDQQTF